MNFNSVVPGGTHKAVIGKCNAGKRSLVACDDLEQMSCLDVPGIDLVWVKRARKNYFSSIIQLQTDKLTTLVRSKHSEFLLLEDIIGVESAIKTAGEKSVGI